MPRRAGRGARAAGGAKKRHPDRSPGAGGRGARARWRVWGVLRVIGLLLLIINKKWGTKGLFLDNGSRSFLSYPPQAAQNKIFSGID